MMFIIQLIYLGISLLVLEQYIVTGEFFKNHRLLPMILTMTCVYNFYQVAECVTGASGVFSLLEDLLLIQSLYVILYYSRDFLYLQFSKLSELVLLVSIFAVDVILLITYKQHRSYELILTIMVLAYAAVIAGMGIYAWRKRTYRREERNITVRVYLMFSGALACLIFRNLGDVGEIVVPTLLAVIWIVISYSLKKGDFVDTQTMLQHQVFITSEFATILLDSDLEYISANEKAKEIFPQFQNIMKQEKNVFPLREEAEKLSSMEHHAIEYSLGNRIYQLSMTPEFFQEHLKGYIFYMFDITDQKMETQKMQEQKLAAEKQTRLKSQFLARMSHDLRSPLHAILGIADIMIGKKELSSKSRSLMNGIRQAGMGLLELVNSILDFSKIESGKLELVRSTYDIESLLEEISLQCAVNLQSKTVDLILTFDNEHPKEVIGDALRIRSMIHNLMSNAVKFTETGSINCDVHMEMMEAQNKVLVSCRISDTGVGMSEEQLKHVFGEYVSFAGDRNMEGTGLGLDIVKQMAEMMDGDIVAESDGVSGSVFTLTFYQDVAVDTFTQCPPVSFTREGLLRQSVQWLKDAAIRPNWIYPKATVLVADDMNINLEIFKELAAEWKFSIDTVKDGRKAVEAVRNKTYQLIFLDYMMPGLSGMETAEQIRSFTKAPIVLLTADISDDTRNQISQYGINAFLGKPIKMSRFQKTVEQLMDKSYREMPSSQEDSMRQMYQDEQSAKIYKATMEAYALEMEELLGELPEYYRTDQAMLRTKIHGIKGISRQVGHMEISESAEILEMALKTDNRVFLDSHFEPFMEALKDEVEDVKMYS